MKDQSATPSSGEVGRRRELFDLGRAMIDHCRALSLAPVVYGSLAYLALTGDAALGVHDIDFLIDEDAFTRLLERVGLDEACRAEETSYHTIKIFRAGAKVSFDSISHYLAGLSWTKQTHVVDGLEFDAVDKQTLVEAYRRGAATIPQNRDAYLRKLLGLGVAP
jgi:hypothetical protein